MADRTSLDRFFGLFRGNCDFYVRHQPPFKEVEGKMKPRSVGFAKDPETGEFMPATRERFKEHLSGGDGLALSPLTNDEGKTNVCFFAVIDIDVYNVNFTPLVKRLYDVGLMFAACLSKSGGLHIYFFFANSEPSSAAIEALERVVAVFGLKKMYPKLEIFPKQASYVPGEGVASCLFLPFYNAAHSSRQNMITAEGQALPLNKALPVMESMLTSTKEMHKTLDDLPYNDAPYCVQMILLSGALEENSGRNDFLFTVALYLKLKFPDGFVDELRQANDMLGVPLEDREVDAIYSSVTAKDYQIWGRCKKSPCSDYCDKRLCREREFGVGRGKGNLVSNVEFGKIVRMLSEEPYYLMEARLAGTEDYVQVRIDGEADLLNQKVVQKACIRYLNQTPVTVKQLVWEKTLNDCLANIEEVEVAKGTDTTEASALRACFMRFLTHRQTHGDQPYLVKTGQVLHRDGMFYFTSEGITQYLATERFSLSGHNLREMLISYGCSAGELPYMSSHGEERIISCWKKPDDEELLEMSVFYEDVYEGDADILQKTATKQGEEEDGFGSSDNAVKKQKGANKNKKASKSAKENDDFDVDF
jgi:hypothetical protein